MTCMLKHTRAVYVNCKSGVSGVTYNKKRKHWEAYITFQQVDHYLGSYKAKQGAIEARIEGEKKYFDPYINNEAKRKQDCRIQQMTKTKLLINNRFTIANAILQPTDIEKQGVISHQFFSD